MDAETAPLQLRQCFGQVEQFAAGGFVENSQQACQFETPTSGDAPGVSIIEKDQIGADLFGQQNGLALTEMESVEFRIGRVFCRDNFQPGRRGMKALPDRFWSLSGHQFAKHFGRDDDFVE